MPPQVQPVYQKKGTVMMNEAAAHMSSFTVANLDEKSETDDSFNRSDDDDEEAGL